MDDCDCSMGDDGATPTKCPQCSLREATIGDRVLRYAKLTKDAFYGPQIKKLTAADRLSITAFIEAHGHETPEEWTVSVRDHLLVSDRRAKLVIDDTLTCLR